MVDETTDFKALIIAYAEDRQLCYGWGTITGCEISQGHNCVNMIVKFTSSEDNGYDSGSHIITYSDLLGWVCEKIDN